MSIQYTDKPRYVGILRPELMPSCGAVFQITPNINNVDTALFIGITGDLEASMAEIRDSKNHPLSLSGHIREMAVIYEVHNDPENRLRRGRQLVDETQTCLWRQHVAAVFNKTTHRIQIRSPEISITMNRRAGRVSKRPPCPSVHCGGSHGRPTHLILHT